MLLYEQAKSFSDELGKASEARAFPRKKQGGSGGRHAALEKRALSMKILGFHRFCNDFT